MSVLSETNSDEEEIEDGQIEFEPDPEQAKDTSDATGAQDNEGDLNAGADSSGQNFDPQEKDSFVDLWQPDKNPVNLRCGYGPNVNSQCFLYALLQIFGHIEPLRNFLKYQLAECSSCNKILILNFIVF